ncbi:MAG: tetratricopeptide repeat protein [Methanobacteriota archaeon]
MQPPSVRFVLAILVATSSASFAAASASAGDPLAVGPPVLLAGRIRGSVDAPAIAVSGPSPELASALVAARAGTIEVVHVYQEAVVVQGLSGTSDLVRVREPTVHREALRLSDARLSAVAARGDATLAVLPSASGPSSATFEVRGGSAVVDWLDGPALVRPVDDDADSTRVGGRSELQFSYSYEGEAFRVAAPLDATFHGAMRAYFWGADVEVAHAGGVERFSTGAYREPGPDGASYREVLSILLVTTGSGEAFVSSDRPVALHGSAADVGVDGAAVFHDVVGELLLEGRRYVAIDEPRVAVSGALLLGFRLPVGGEGLRLLGAGADRAAATVSGDVRSVSLAAVPTDVGTTGMHWLLPLGLVAAASGLGLAAGWRMGLAPRVLLARLRRRRSRGARSAPDDPELLVATRLLAAERYEEASRYFDRYLARHGSDTAARAALGTCLLQRGDPEGALRCYLDAARADPQDEVMSYMVAHVSARLGRPDQALSWLAKTHDLSPGIAFQAREDPAFEPLWGDPRFRAILMTDRSMPAEEAAMMYR